MSTRFLKRIPSTMEASVSLKVSTRVRLSGAKMTLAGSTDLLHTDITAFIGLPPLDIACPPVFYDILF